jgi:predicted CopG family antitoxin
LSVVSFFLADSLLLPRARGRSSGGDVAELLRVAFNESGSSGTGLLYQVEPPLDIMEEGTTKAGRGRELFSINSVNEQVVAVKSFGDVVRRLLVSKRPGKEHLSLLGGGGEEGEEEKERGNAKQRKKSNSDSADSSSSSSSSSFWQNLKSSFFGRGDGEEGTEKKKNFLQRQLGQSLEQGEEVKDDNRIHVFSLATGHLYERFSE